MSGPGLAIQSTTATASPAKSALRDPVWVRVLLTTMAVGTIVVIIVLPVALVFAQAFENGYRAYLEAISSEEARAAIRLTLVTTAIVVPANTVFGLAAAYATTRFDFPGKRLFLTIMDLPLTVSPVISGMLFILLFGAQGWMGPLLSAHDIRIVFAPPAIVLATMFVTFPFVARSLISLMDTQGADEDEAAVLLGASAFQLFFRVTLPRIKWALLFGVILCTARAMGEFGAVSVVSGHIRGMTNTVPLHVEILYNEYAFSASFAVASLLVFLAFGTLLVKTWVERSARRPT
jgi:sulfate transport system permease protein